MGKKSLGEKLQKKIHNATDAIKDTVDDIDFPDVKVPKKVKKAAHNAAENIQDAAAAVKNKAEDIDLPDVKAPNIVKGIFDREEEETAPSIIEGAKVLSTESALKLVYYLMAVNGEIYHAEEEKFILIGKELDPAFEKNRKAIVKACETHTKKAEGKNNYYTAVQKGVDTAIFMSEPSKDSFITPKLLIWDLLTIAYSDDEYDATEKKLIRHIVKELNVNKADFLEMESSFLTLVDIQKEIDWIKTTDRPYKEIEVVVNELTERQKIIFESVNDLIML